MSEGGQSLGWSAKFDFLYFVDFHRSCQNKILYLTNFHLNMVDKIFFISLSKINCVNFLVLQFYGKSTLFREFVTATGLYCVRQNFCPIHSELFTVHTFLGAKLLCELTCPSLTHSLKFNIYLDRKC